MTGLPNESELIDGIVSGDESAFRTLVELYKEPVLNLCYSILNNRADAEDIAQEVFIEVFHSAGKFRKDCRLFTWIYRIAINKSLNYLRSRKNHKWLTGLDKILGIEEMHPHVPLQDEGSEQHAEHQELQRILYSAVDSLSEKQRIAFTLHKFDNLPQKEIAEIMEMSVPAVETLIHRAKKNLQSKLQHYYKKYKN